MADLVLDVVAMQGMATHVDAAKVAFDESALVAAGSASFGSAEVEAALGNAAGVLEDMIAVLAEDASTLSSHITAVAGTITAADVSLARKLG